MKAMYLSPVVIYIALKIKGIQGLRSKKIIEMYGLDEGKFKEYFHQVNGLFKRKREGKFIEINRKYGVLD